MTYGDGVCDVNIRDLLAFHKQNGKIATLTAVQVDQRFGVLELKDNTVRAFREKAQRDNEYILSLIHISPRVHIDGEVWHLDVGSSHPGAEAGPKGDVYKRQTMVYSASQVTGQSSA